jgi:hypothetical protein
VEEGIVSPWSWDLWFPRRRDISPSLHIKRGHSCPHEWQTIIDGNECPAKITVASFYRAQLCFPAAETD